MFDLASKRNSKTPVLCLHGIDRSFGGARQGEKFLAIRQFNKLSKSPQGFERLCAGSILGKNHLLVTLPALSTRKKKNGPRLVSRCNVVKRWQPVQKIPQMPTPSGQYHSHFVLPLHERRHRALKPLPQNNFSSHDIWSAFMPAVMSFKISDNSTKHRICAN